MSPFCQIELFCQSEGQECNPDIVTCLSDAAFQAVEKIVRVSMSNYYLGRAQNLQSENFIDLNTSALP